MRIKKLISCLLLTTCVFTASNIVFNEKANADTVNDSVVENLESQDGANKESIIQPRIAGVVLVTAKSGANIRKDAGTNYSKIPPAASKGECLDYYGKTKKGTDGVDWYQVEWQGKVGWISSDVSELG